MRTSIYKLLLECTCNMKEIQYDVSQFISKHNALISAAKRSLLYIKILIHKESLLSNTSANCTTMCTCFCAIFISLTNALPENMGDLRANSCNKSKCDTAPCNAAVTSYEAPKTNNGNCH